MTPRQNADAARRRRLDKVAELAVLELYDRRRSVAGHDYGSGQRQTELGRRRRELGELGEADRLTRQLLRVTARRIAAQRLRRLDREGYRAHTPASARTIATWRSIAATANADELDAFVAGDAVEVFGAYRGPGRVAVTAAAGPRDTVTVELEGLRVVIVYAEQLELVDAELELERHERFGAMPSRPASAPLEAPHPAAGAQQQLEAELGVGGRRYLETLGRPLLQVTSDELEGMAGRLQVQLDNGTRIYSSAGEVGRGDAQRIVDAIAVELERRRPARVAAGELDPMTDAAAHAPTCGQLGPCDCGADRRRAAAALELDAPALPRTQRTVAHELRVALELQPAGDVERRVLADRIAELRAELDELLEAAGIPAGDREAERAAALIGAGMAQGRAWRAAREQVPA